MQLGIPKETADGETRVAVTPDTVKKFKTKGFDILVESGAGEKAGFNDSDYKDKGAAIVDRAKALSADIVVKINPPSGDEISKLKNGAWLVGMLEPYHTDFAPYAKAGVNAIAMELVPRTSRAQSMDVLSSQAGIAGYRAVLEAAVQFPRFFPMMMIASVMAAGERLTVPPGRRARDRRGRDRGRGPGREDLRRREGCC